MKSREHVFIGLLFATAVGANVPLGVWRHGLRRFSPSWFLAVHASIPLLVAIRLSLVSSNWVVAPEMALAIVAQIAGGRLARLWNRSSHSESFDVDDS